jgi:hypothetical protein
MARQADPLEHVRVTSPCSYDWDSMIGNDQVRFCAHCNLSVHNLSEMTPKQALRLVVGSRGRLCVRYRQAPDDTIETARLPARLHQIKRRATRLAAGAFSAALSLTSTAAAAQPAPSSRVALLSGVEGAALTQTPRAQSLQPSGSTLVGQILDPAGAAVPGSRIILTNAQTGIEQTTTSNDEGQYLFRSVEAGLYTLRVEQAGFKTAIVEGIALNDDDVKMVNATLEVGDLYTSESVTVGSAEMAEPSLPLVKAAMDNDMAALKQLLDAGANINATDTVYHASALMLAANNGNLEIVQALLWAGADVNVTNSRGETALMYLSDHSTAGIVKALVAAGAKLNLQDEDGDTALISAAVSNNKDVLQALLDAGAKVNMKNKKGETALMIAAGLNSIDSTRALMMAGADVYERDAEGKTALTHARENKNRQVIKILRTFGAIEYLQ